VNYRKDFSIRGGVNNTQEDIRRILGLGDIIRHFKVFCGVQVRFKIALIQQT
jgi:hypothetical protein